VRERERERERELEWKPERYLEGRERKTQECGFYSINITGL
jgi:hypothetical protein